MTDFLENFYSKLNSKSDYPHSILKIGSAYNAKILDFLKRYNILFDVSKITFGIYSYSNERVTERVYQISTGVYLYIQLIPTMPISSNSEELYNLEFIYDQKYKEYLKIFLNKLNKEIKNGD